MLFRLFYLGGCKDGALQAAEKPPSTVIPIRQPTERNLALSIFNAVQDSSPCGPKPPSGDGSSPAAPRNNRLGGFFRSLFSPALSAPVRDPGQVSAELR